MLNQSEIQRYSRQIRLREIGVAGQERLKSARVLVIGAGGLGSPVLQYLVAAGVGHIGIVDYDRIDLSNLNRQVLYATDEVGQSKADRAAGRLREMNPDTEIRTWAERLTPANALTILADYDIVVDCTDNFPVRFLINDAAVMLDKPVVYGAVYQFEGQVTVFNYQGGPTLRCLLPEPPHPLEVPSCAEGGVIGTIAGMIGTLQAAEVIKLILGIGDVLRGKVFVYDSLTCESYFFHLERNPELRPVEELKVYDEACQDEIPVRCLTYDEVRKMLDGGEAVQVIDVGDPADYADHGMPCLRIPVYEIAARLGEIPADRPV
ncbi:MAG: HesA/MoeB/ThiF family protein, partial [Bacteroidales bacterium]